MKIVKLEAAIDWNPCVGHHIAVDDTVEITDGELEQIWQGYYEVAVNRNYSENFAQYLRELILLRCGK